MASDDNVKRDDDVSNNDADANIDINNKDEDLKKYDDDDKKDNNQSEQQITEEDSTNDVNKNDQDVDDDDTDIDTTEITRDSIMESVELPKIFSTPYRPDLIHKVFVNLESHSFQPQGRHPTAGMDVVADTNDPPTGRGISRIARAQGGGGGRRGEGAEVASTRGGRQAHPPIAERVIYKKLNKKEKRLALCSAIAATASKDLIISRGHKIAKYLEQYGDNFPIILNDTIVQYSTTRQVTSLFKRIHIQDDLDRLHNRKARSGRPSLRGRSKKAGKSILFVTHDSNVKLKNATGALPGVDVKSVSELSVLDLAPGSTPIRLTIFTKSAIEQIGKLESTHLQTMIIPEVQAQ